jgi:diguanylate cyclase (GGDEF)-like protein
MTLSKRALTIILPVILLSNILIALAVYWIQRSNIEHAEIARLSRQVDRLKSLFDKEIDFTRNLVFLMQTGDATRSFVRETDENFRTTAIGVKVQDGIEFFSNNSNRFVSFAILQNDLKVEYYFEKSDDPFASIHAIQLEAAERLTRGSDLVSDDFVMDDGQPLLIHSELIDPTTFSTPLATQKETALIIQAAVRPRDFMKMKAELEKEYGTPVRIASEITVERDAFTAVRTLLPNLKVGLGLTERYLAVRVQSLKITLASGCLILSLVLVGLLLFLIRRTVTGPISTLDRQVTDVLSGRRQNLDRMTNGGEIDRLSANIKTLHDQVLDTLDKVQTASWTDVLTGISNRLHFSLIGERMFDSAQASQRKLSLLFIDLDNFKFVNDTFGHATGDAVLRQFTAICEAILDPLRKAQPERPPLLARLSGDEFAILLCETEEDSSARDIASRIIEAFAEGLTVEDETYPVTASIGIACYPADAQSFTQLVSSADKAMYHAKARGKNGTARYSLEFADGDERVEKIKSELQRLDPDEEFSLVYMPIASRSGTIEKCEALLRWNSPTLGTVSPGEFIPIAESNALFSKIDRWVLRTAVGDLKPLQQIFGEHMLLSINISTAELSSSTIIRDSVEALQHHGASASSVEIELTETFAAKIPVKAKRVVEGLKEAGFKISLDDFGSGYTSLKQILEFPLDTVKLDRELVMKIREPRGLQTLTAIIDMCHSQNCLVVAEGVEDNATQAALALAGCDLFQGFGIYRPTSLADLRAQNPVAEARVETRNMRAAGT